MTHLGARASFPGWDPIGRVNPLPHNELVRSRLQKPQMDAAHGESQTAHRLRLQEGAR